MKFGQFSDVLLHEVFIEDEIKETNKMRTLKTLHNVKDYHTPSSIVGKIASLARCKKLVLTHLVPTKFNEKKLKKIVKKDFGKDPIVKAVGGTADSIICEFSSEKPLRIEFKVTNIGRIHFYLAPRVES